MAANLKAKISPEASVTQPCCTNKNLLIKHLKILGGIVIVLVILAIIFKDKFLAATVNGKPVFRSQINKQLVKTYGKEALENLIIEDLILNESRKNNIVISEGDIDKEIEKVSKTLPQGMKLEDALKLQNMSMADFRSQVKLTLEINKLLEKDIAVTPEEIDGYLKDNGKTLTATSEAEKRTQAEEILKQQKFSTQMQSWISDLLAKAKINRFLK